MTQQQKEIYIITILEKNVDIPFWEADKKN